MLDTEAVISSRIASVDKGGVIEGAGVGVEVDVEVCTMSNVWIIELNRSL